MTVTEPIDRTHAESQVAIEWIRAWVEARRQEIAAWQPRPMPRPCFCTYEPNIGQCPCACHEGTDR